MNGSDLKDLRGRLGLSQKEFGNLIGDSLGRKYGSTAVSNWETEKTPIPSTVDAFLDALELGENLEGLRPSTEPRIPDSAPTEDTPGGYAQQAPLSSSGIYARACTDLWGMGAMLCSTLGAVTGSRKLVQDGYIIDGDKEALGRAWGKLAETNETWRRMLIGATSGGAWVEVALVTSTTASKMWENHRRREPEEPQVVTIVEPDGEPSPTAAFVA